jgi:hypothetical protein
VSDDLIPQGRPSPPTDDEPGRGRLPVEPTTHRPFDPWRRWNPVDDTPDPAPEAPVQEPVISAVATEAPPRTDVDVLPPAGLEPEPEPEPEAASQPASQPAQDARHVDVYEDTTLRSDISKAWRRSGLGSVPRRSLFRLFALSLAILFVCVASGVLFVVLRPAPHRARVDILYESPPSSAGATQLDRQFATQVVIMRGRSVLGPVSRTERTSIESLERSVSVQVVPGTEVLRVTVTRRDADRARELAQSVAETYIGVVTVGSGGAGQQSAAAIESDIKELTADLDEAQRGLQEATRAGDTTEANRLQGRAASLLQRIGTLQGRLASLPDALQQAQPRIVVPAYVLRSTLVPRLVRGIASGALIGLLLAGLLTGALLRHLRE